MSGLESMTVPVPIGNTPDAFQSARHGLLGPPGDPPEGGGYARAMDGDTFVAALRPLLEATGAEVVPAADAGPDDVALSANGTTVFVRVPHLDGALDRLVGIVEQELGAPLAELVREDKQRAVARLHDLGAFNLRKSVEDVATALGVSRFTVYNYLDRRDGV